MCIGILRGLQLWFVSSFSGSHWLTSHCNAYRFFILLLVLATIAAGLILFNLNLPQVVQPLHLLLSSLLLTALFAYRLKVS